MSPQFFFLSGHRHAGHKGDDLSVPHLVADLILLLVGVAETFSQS